MQKSLVLAAVAALSVFGSSGAFAQTAATQTIALSASVPSSCSINGTQTGLAGETINIPTAGGAVANTAYQQPTTGGYSMSCNAPTTIQITSQNDGMVNPTTLTGYTTQFNYTAVATVGGLLSNTSETLTTTGTGAPNTSAGTLAPAYANGKVTVNVTPAAGVSNLAPGTFADTLTVKLTPQ